MIEENLSLAILFLCLTGMTYVETIAVQARVLGAFNGTASLGFHISTVMLLANRVFTAVALVFIGLLVDTGTHYQSLLLVYSMVGFSVFGLSLLVDRRPKILEVLYQVHHRYLHSNHVMPASEIGNGSRYVFRCDRAIITVGLFSFLGFLLPSAFASIFPEFRATLLQTGFIFNSVATIFNVLIVERRIAAICESGDKLEIRCLIFNYGINRALGILISGIILLIPFLFIS